MRTDGLISCVLCTLMAGVLLSTGGVGVLAGLFLLACGAYRVRTAPPRLALSMHRHHRSGLGV